MDQITPTQSAPLPHVEQAIKSVEIAATLVSKAEFARRAEVPESTLRDVGRPNWGCRLETLKKLEVAAIAIQREHSTEAA